MKFAKSLLALAAFGAASAASALTINAAPAAAPSAVAESISRDNGNSYNNIRPTGFHVTNSTVGSFYTLCVELSQPFAPLPNTYTPEANGSANGFTAAQADGLARLFQVSNFQSSNGGSVDTDMEFIALQLAAWNVMYDTDADVTMGSFRLASNNNGANGLANQWLSAAAALSGTTFTVGKLHSPTEQDLVTSVPEPSTYALMLAGLAGMGFVARRRASR